MSETAIGFGYTSQTATNYNCIFPYTEKFAFKLVGAKWKSKCFFRLFMRISVNSYSMDNNVRWLLFYVLSWNRCTPPIICGYVGGPEFSDSNICKGKWPDFLQSASSAPASPLTQYLECLGLWNICQRLLYWFFKLFLLLIQFWIVYWFYLKDRWWQFVLGLPSPLVLMEFSPTKFKLKGKQYVNWPV